MIVRLTYLGNMQDNFFFKRNQLIVKGEFHLEDIRWVEKNVYYIPDKDNKQKKAKNAV